ncbi:MAG: C1 family peptidase [Elusimicrobia bacterium]|nr:C1 family peptidase [Elusimicrobiota bacterium]
MKNGKRFWILPAGVLLAATSAIGVFAQDQFGITALNAKIKSAKGSWKAGVTSVSTLSDDEFQSRLLSPQDIADSAKMAKSLKRMPLNESFALDASMDWRAKGIETPVRDQGHCGSCWAFSMSGAEELQLLIKKPDVYGKSGAEVQRAPQALVSCDTKMKGCKGGNLNAGYLVDTGLPAESLYPYKSGTSGENGTCGEGAVDQDWKSKTEKISDWGSVEFTVDAMKKAVSQYGPIPSSMMVFEDFKHYKSGVYTLTPGSKFLGGHAILIVGFDDTDQSFLVKNSWTTGWGDKGYFKMGYSEVGCDILDMLFKHKKVNFGCATIAYNMKSKRSVRTAPLMEEEAVNRALNLLLSPLP